MGTFRHPVDAGEDARIKRLTRNWHHTRWCAPPLAAAIGLLAEEAVISEREFPCILLDRKAFNYFEVATLFTELKILGRRCDLGYPGPVQIWP